eukprot:Gb_16964 [translate_table: standard]
MAGQPKSNTNRRGKNGGKRNEGHVASSHEEHKPRTKLAFKLPLSILEDMKHEHGAGNDSQDHMTVAQPTNQVAIESPFKDGERSSKKRKLSLSSKYLSASSNDSTPSASGPGTKTATVSSGQKGNTTSQSLQVADSDTAASLSELQIVTPILDKKVLEAILDKVQKKDKYQVFSKPVDLRELTDYLQVIKTPMDFSTIRSNLERGVYDNLEDFERDVLLVGSNAMQYNQPKTVYYKQGRSMQELARKEFQKLRSDPKWSQVKPKSLKKRKYEQSQNLEVTKPVPASSLYQQTETCLPEKNMLVNVLDNVGKKDENAVYSKSVDQIEKLELASKWPQVKPRSSKKGKYGGRESLEVTGPTPADSLDQQTETPLPEKNMLVDALDNIEEKDKDDLLSKPVDPMEVDEQIQTPQAPDPVTETTPVEQQIATTFPNKNMLGNILDRKDKLKVFSKPVDPQELKDYLQVIKNPMDFGTIQKNLERGDYDKLEDFEEDVLLVSSNAMQYNKPNTVLYKQGRSMQELARKEFQNLRSDPTCTQAMPCLVKKGKSEQIESLIVTKPVLANSLDEQRETPLPRKIMFVDVAHSVAENNKDGKLRPEPKRTEVKHKSVKRGRSEQSQSIEVTQPIPGDSLGQPTKTPLLEKNMLVDVPDNIEKDNNEVLSEPVIPMEVDKQSQSLQAIDSVREATPEDPHLATPLPDKKVLGNILDKIQVKDKFQAFSKSVDLRERDVLLVSSNAMQYNRPNTVYYKQVQYLSTLARVEIILHSRKRMLVPGLFNAGTPLLEKNVLGDIHDNFQEKERDGVMSKLAEVEEQSQNMQATDPVPDATPVETQTMASLLDKKVLGNILDKIQEEDEYGVFSKPVDLEELPDYLDVIRNPMDFGTIRNNLKRGVYANLEQFEDDILLVCSNAMQYNRPDTVYHKQGESMHALATKYFRTLRVDPNAIEIELKSTPKIRSSQSSKKSTKKQLYATINGDDHALLLDSEASKSKETAACMDKTPYAKDQRNIMLLSEDRRYTYKPNQQGNKDDPISATLGESKQLVPTNEIYSQYPYARSLARFCVGLGPIAWKIAAKKIEQALPPGVPFGPGWVGEDMAPPSARNEKVARGVQSVIPHKVAEPVIGFASSLLRPNLVNKRAFRSIEFPDVPTLNVRPVISLEVEMEEEDDDSNMDNTDTGTDEDDEDDDDDDEDDEDDMKSDDDVDEDMDD